MKEFCSNFQIRQEGCFLVFDEVAKGYMLASRSAETEVQNEKKMRTTKSGRGNGGNILWVYVSQDGADDCSPFVSKRNRPIYMGSPMVQGYTIQTMCWWVDFRQSGKKYKSKI